MNKKPKQKRNVKNISNISLLPVEISNRSAEMDDILKIMEKLLHWAAIIESSDDAIISKSTNGLITSWNRGAQRLYGYTSDEVVGKPVSLLIPPSKKDDFSFIMKQLRDGKRVEHYETQRIAKKR